MVKISLKVLLVLLLSNNSFAQTDDCKPSLYKLGEKNLCFSSKLRSYLTQSCSSGKCGAIELIDKAKTLDRSKIPTLDSRHSGARTCAALGGKTTVVTSEKTQDQLCLCLAKDGSGVSCSKLGLL